MEVHPPAGPVESVKDFLIHLAMISIGILIALGLEQAVEAWHHHEIGVQTRENIIAELRDNQRELDVVRARAKQNKEQLLKSLATIRALLAHQSVKNAEVSVNVNGADLNSVSWTTAAATGALSYMGYAEAKRFAKSYDLQSMLLHEQDAQFNTAGNALAMLSFGSDSPSKPADDQLKAAEQEILHALAELSMWDQLALQLSNEYTRVLKEH